MKIAAILLSILACAQSLSFASLFNDEWNNFKLTYGKHYYNGYEEITRMNRYMKNFDEITKHTLGLVLYKLGMNKFGDMEGQHFRQTNKLFSLSEQNLIDCSTSFGNDGCEGGLMTNSYNYIKANKGIDTEQSDPYLEVDLKCEYNANYTDHGYINYERCYEEALKASILAIGPISIGIHDSHHSFNLFEEGVYDDSDCTSLFIDHGVLVVDYGTTKEGFNYWIVKNLLGSMWGDNGYILMSRNQANQCRIYRVVLVDLPY